jgi:hypothetical protein
MSRSVTLTICLAAFVLLATFRGQPAHASTCANYANQAAAQRAADTRDGDGDGLYCESLPCPCAQPAAEPGGGVPKPSAHAGTNPAGCVRPDGVQNISFTATKYPHIRRHFLDALRRGWPRTLVLTGPAPMRAETGCSPRIAPGRIRIATNTRPPSGGVGDQGSSGASTRPAGAPTSATSPRARTARTARRWAPSFAASATGRGFGTPSTDAATAGNPDHCDFPATARRGRGEVLYGEGHGARRVAFPPAAGRR